MSLHDIPALNAGLNALATVLMTCGFVFIRQALRQPVGPGRTAALARHRAAMLAAFLLLAEWAMIRMAMAQPRWWPLAAQQQQQQQ